MVLRTIFETRATSGSAGSAYAPPRLTKPSCFLRNSAAANGSSNSLRDRGGDRAAADRDAAGEDFRRLDEKQIGRARADIDE